MLLFDGSDDVSRADNELFSIQALEKKRPRLHAPFKEEIRRTKSCTRGL
jgi:hypothetical protein